MKYFAVIAFVILLAVAGMEGYSQPPTKLKSGESGFVIKRGTNIAHWLS